LGFVKSGGLNKKMIPKNAKTLPRLNRVSEPDLIDWRSNNGKNYVQIKNQGQCGSWLSMLKI